MWDLNTIRRMNGEDTAPAYPSAGGLAAWGDLQAKDIGKGWYALRGTLRGRHINIVVRKPQLPPGAVIVSHS